MRRKTRAFTEAEERAWRAMRAADGQPDGSFTLANDAPKPKPWRAENVETRQLRLLDGMDCLPGQQDLFEGSE